MKLQSRLTSLSFALASVSLLLTSPPSLAAYGNYKGDYSAASQGSSSQVKTLDDGLYIGLAGGYDSYRIRSNINATFNGDTFTGNPAISTTGFVGGLFGGYGEYYRNFLYLAGEAFVNLSGASSTSTFFDTDATTSYNTRLSAGTSFGLGLLPGLKVNDSSLFYLRLGCVWANFEDRENFATAGLGTSTNPSSWQMGFVYGLGIETAIYQNFSLRAEYTRSDFSDSSHTPFGTVYSPYDNQFMLGLIYHVY